jgi:uncharacterized membrane protein YfcA
MITGPVNSSIDFIGMTAIDLRGTTMTAILLMYLLDGAVAGLLAGLLGIGGGVVIVPMLVFCFARQGIPDALIMQMALGTSLASIMFTAVASFRAHQRRGAVHWDVVRKIIIGILTGTFLGSCIAAQLSTRFLKGFFVVFLYFVTIQILTNTKPKPSRQIPGHAAMFGVGNVIGIVSSLVGIGGGALSVPFMIWRNMTVHHAIGTAAAIGFPIAIAGTIGYIYNGLAIQGLPDYSVGYIYLPALFGIVVTSVLTAPLGVRLAHSLPVNRLKRIFAFLLLVVATRMMIGIL